MAAICSNDVANYPADSFEKMRELAAAHSYSFPYLHDESQAVASAYQAQHTPEVFLFDAGGSLVYTGAVDDSVEAAEASASYLPRRDRRGTGRRFAPVSLHQSGGMHH